jgi:hypothetical protein
MYFKQHVLLKTKYTEVEFDWFLLARVHQRLAPGFARVRSGSLIMFALTRLQTQVPKPDQILFLPKSTVMDTISHTSLPQWILRERIQEYKRRVQKFIVANFKHGISIHTNTCTYEKNICLSFEPFCWFMKGKFKSCTRATLNYYITYKT